jgi:hypothetical protein
MQKKDSTHEEDFGSMINDRKCSGTVRLLTNKRRS